MGKLERIKNQIAALLDKTVDRGASEQEMLMAIKKAEQLMRKYCIAMSELPNRGNQDKCVLKLHPKFKTGYKTEYFLSALAELFDCEYFWNNQNVAFFGYKEDVKLCIYFYDLILMICFREKEAFLKLYKKVAKGKGQNGRTLAANFVKGFLFSIAAKLERMYSEKKAESNSNERGLVLAKKKRVENEFAAQEFNIRTVSSSLEIRSYEAFLRGKKRGDETELLYAVEGSVHSPQLGISGPVL